MDKKTIVAGITHGDINGIGYEIIMKAFQDPTLLDLCVPVVYGSPKAAAYYRKVLRITDFNFNNIRSAADALPQRVNLINCLTDDIQVELGKITAEGGHAARAALECAASDLTDGKIDLLVTAPVSKENIHSEKFPYTGHTDWLRDLTGSDDVLMLMVSENLKIGFATEHLPLRQVADAITIAGLLGKLRLLNRSLLQDFAVRGPRIAILGLNPHAGDGGLLGNEEGEIIIPAIARANEEGILAFGPYSPDGFFGSGTFSRFDAVLAMFHDQAMPVFKAFAFETGVNFTAGLPVIRTSPAHGTAFDRAGRDEASGNSLRQAIYTAVDICRNREMYHELTRNPLQPQKIEVHPDHSDELPPEADNYEHSL